MTASLIAKNSYGGRVFRDSQGKITYFRFNQIQAIVPRGGIQDVSVVFLNENQSVIVNPDVATALIDALSDPQT